MVTDAPPIDFGDNSDVACPSAREVRAELTGAGWCAGGTSEERPRLW